MFCGVNGWFLWEGGGERGEGYENNTNTNKHETNL